MRPSRSFRELYSAASSRLSRLRGYSVDGLSHGISEKDKCLSYVVIETQNLWSNFSRSYILSCVLRPKRMSLGRVEVSNASVNTPGDVLLLAARVHRGQTASAPTTRRDEPPWHDRNILLKTCSQLGCSNLSNIINALSIQTRVLEDLPVFRNFYAHRNEDTARKAVDLGKLKYLIISESHPTAVLSASPHKRPQPLILDFLDDLGILIEFLCV